MYIDTNSDDVAPGPRTPDRHVRSRWLTPAEGDTSPTLREWFPDNNPVQISSGRSLHDSEDHFPGAASSGFNRELTADQEILRKPYFDVPITLSWKRFILIVSKYPRLRASNAISQTGLWRLRVMYCQH